MEGWNKLTKQRPKDTQRIFYIEEYTNGEKIVRMGFFWKLGSRSIDKILSRNFTYRIASFNPDNTKEKNKGAGCCFKESLESNFIRWWLPCDLKIPSNVKIEF